MADQVPTTWEEVFKHERFTQLVEQRKEADGKVKTLEQQLASMKSAHETAVQEFENKLKAAQTGPQDKLTAMEQSLTELATRYEETAKSLQSERNSRIRLEVAQELGIPEFANDLHGKDADEMRAHGGEIIKRINARLEGAAPGVVPRGGGNPTPTVTAAQMQDPKWVRENVAAIQAAAQNGTLPT